MDNQPEYKLTDISGCWARFTSHGKEVRVAFSGAVLPIEADCQFGMDLKDFSDIVGKHGGELYVRPCDHEAVSAITLPLQRDKTPYGDIVAAYHQLCPTMRQCRTRTTGRDRHIRSAWRRLKSIEAIRELFTKANQSKFLSGRSGKWDRCDLIWILNEENAAKIMEGYYDK